MKPLTTEQKQKLRRDMKSYHVTAVLDKAASDRALAPMPSRVNVLGKDGTRLVLTLGSQASDNKRKG